MIRILINAFFALVVLLVIRVVVSAFSPRPAARKGRPRSVPEPKGGTLVRDPQCGTYVPEAGAVTAGAQRFCSAKCRDAWVATHGAPTKT